MTEQLRSMLESMAVETLKGLGSGDLSAAIALADCLVNEGLGANYTPIMPVRRFSVPYTQLRVALFAQEGVTVTEEQMQQMVGGVEGWIANPRDNVICFNGIDHIEIYEMPEGYGQPQNRPVPMFVDEEGHRQIDDADGELIVGEE